MGKRLVDFDRRYVVLAALLHVVALAACSDPGAGPPTSPEQAREGGVTSELLASGLVTLDFEALSGAVTDQYSALGATFAGAGIAERDINLNPPFPPRSGAKVIVDDAPIITVDFSNPVSSAGGFVTGNRIITLQCYNRNDLEVGTASLPAANYIGAAAGVDPNYFLGIVAQRITRCTFTGVGNSFTVDDFTYDQTTAGRRPSTAGDASVGSRKPPFDSESQTHYVCAASSHGAGGIVPKGWWYKALRYYQQCDRSKPGAELKPNGWELVSLYDKPIGTGLLVCITNPPAGHTPGQLWQLVKTLPDDPAQCNWRFAAFRTTALVDIKRVETLVAPLAP